MKKLFLGLLMAVFTLSIYSCRETTEENIETDMERTGEEIETEVEETEREIETEYEEEVNETDDVQ